MHANAMSPAVGSAIAHQIRNHSPGLEHTVLGNQRSRRDVSFEQPGRPELKQQEK